MKTTILCIVSLIVMQTGIAQEKKPGQRNNLYTNGVYDPYKVPDTRIDNMGYWRKAAELGLVPVAPYTDVPLGEFKGSGIEAKGVWRDDSPDVPVTTQNSTQSENSVFVDPNNPDHVLQSNNSTQNPVGSLYGANYLFSYDFGETWGGSVSGAGGSNSGDPATAIGLNGRRFVGFINSAGGQGVAYSDNGTTWTSVQAGTPPGGSNILDKNHLWIDNSQASPYKSYIYNAWTGFGNANDAEIEFVRSTNNGLSYSSHLNISSAVNAGSHNQGVNLSSGPNGEVYACWAIYDSWPSDEKAIGFAKSLNGGATFSSATRVIGNIKGIRNTGTGKNMRVNSFPSMTVDISDGPHRGNIYIVWTNVGFPGTNTGTDLSVYMIRSSNQGSSWSTPVKVNQDAFGVGKKHYFPWITCDPETGTLSVIFYDDRNVTSTQCEVWCANSFDGGATWEDFRVSDVSFTPSPIPGLASSYMGDYLGISARDGKVYPVWTDNRTGTVMTYTSPFLTNNLARPTSLSANVVFETGEAELEWTFTTVPGFQYFVVYRDKVQIGTTVNNDFTDLLPDYGIYEYEVTAMHETGESSAAKVTSQWGDAQVEVNPAAIVQNLPVNATATRTISVSNAGQLGLDYSISASSLATDDPKAYCTPTADCSYGDGFTSFTLGTISNLNSGCSPNGYGNFTAMSTDVKPGNSYSASFRTGYDDQYVCLWIDFNKNEVFENSEMLLNGFFLENKNQTYSTSIVIPSTVSFGTTRMRIKAKWLSTSTDPCANVTYGETEDYTVNVTGWLQMTASQGTILPGNSQVFSLNLNSQNLSSGSSYQGNIIITSNDPDNSTLNVPVTLNVGPLATLQVSVAASPQQINQGEQSQLTTAPSGGSGNYSYSWTSNPAGFTSQTANPVVYPNETTTYFVAVNDGFSSANGQVTVEVLGQATQSVALIEGWNLMSFNILPANTDMLAVVNPLILQDALYKVTDENGGSIFHLPFPPPSGTWTNSIGILESTEGYYIKTLADASLPITGTRVSLPLAIPLNEGWNMISYPCETPQNALDAVQPLIDEGRLNKVIDETGGVIFHLPFPPPTGQWTNSIGDFRSGKGYYVKVNADCSLTIDNPAKSGTFIQNTKTKRQVTWFAACYANNPYLPMAVIVQPESWMEPGDEVAIFDENLCVGVAVYGGKSDQAIMIPVTFDDSDTPGIDGALQGNPFIIKYFRKNDYVEWGDLSFEITEGQTSFQPLGTSVLKVNLNLLELESLEQGVHLHILPNPVTSEATLKMQFMQPVVVSAEIYSSSGQPKGWIIRNLTVDGEKTITFGKSDYQLNHGIYYLKIYLEEKTTGSSTLKTLRFVIL